jgi:hypothetical protein
VTGVAIAGNSGARWLAFRNSVEELNAFQAPRVLRKYQSDVLHGGAFTVVSPISGERVSVTRSTMLGGHIAYLLPGEPRAWLITGPTRFGFPLWELITETDSQRRSLAGKTPQTADVSGTAIDRLRSFRPGHDGGAQRPRATLLIGETNFAHHFWNELAALGEWLAGATDEEIARLAIVATAEPLGPIAQIFPRLRAASAAPLSIAAARKRLADASIVTRVGSCLVTTAVRQRILAFSEEHSNRSATASTRSLLLAAWPRVWVSVRLSSRTADNLEQFLLELIGKLLSAYPNAAVVFDGFSFPTGFFEDARTTSLREEFSARADDVGAFIESLRQKVDQQLGSAASSRLCSVSGLDLLDAIQLGTFCDYYVCHAGSLQHKIAWFHNIPGLIHLPMNTMSRALWHSAQVESGIVPDILPDGASISTCPPSHGRMRDRNFNYRFRDPAKAADSVLETMRSRLRRPP